MKLQSHCTSMGLVWVWMLGGCSTPPTPSAMEAAGDAEHLTRRINVWDREEAPDLRYPLLALSPNGDLLVYPANGLLRAHRMQGSDPPVPIPGTEGAHSPFFSPGGDWIAFFTEDELAKVSLVTGQRTTIASFAGGRSGSWGDDGTIVFDGPRPGGLWLVPSEGEGDEPVRLTRPGPDEYDHAWPQLLPGSLRVLYTSFREPGAWGDPHNLVLDRETGETVDLLGGPEMEAAMGNEVPRSPQLRYVPSGHLVFSQAGCLGAIPFDAELLSIPGGARTVKSVEDRNFLCGAMMPGRSTWASGFFTRGTDSTRVAQYAIARNGTFVYLPGAPILRSLVWRDRDGREEELPGGPRPWFGPRWSPDGRRVVVVAVDEALRHDLWLYDISTRAWSPLTRSMAGEMGPIWARDGETILYTSSDDPAARRTTLYRLDLRSDSGPERLTERVNAFLPNSVTPEGETLVFEEERLEAGGDWDLGVLELDEPDGTRTLVGGPGLQLRATISPDGRWIAYDTNENGVQEVYVRPFPDTDAGRWLVDRGSRPIWRSDGRELFFRAREGIMAVAVDGGASFRTGTPALLFEAPDSLYYIRSLRHYDASPDGRRFIMVKDEPADAPDLIPRELILVDNVFPRFATPEATESEQRPSGP